MRLKCPDNMQKYRFCDFYEFISFLGAGSFGFVVQVRDLESGDVLAVKIVDRQTQDAKTNLSTEQEVLREFKGASNII